MHVLRFKIRMHLNARLDGSLNIAEDKLKIGFDVLKRLQKRDKRGRSYEEHESY